MIQDLINQVLDIVIELLVIGVGLGLAYVGKLASAYLKTLREKDKLGIIDMLTDRAVELVQAELKGAEGEAKLIKATEYASKFLAEHGIHLSPERLRADIENGYNKLPKSDDGFIFEYEQPEHLGSGPSESD